MLAPVKEWLKQALIDFKMALSPGVDVAADVASCAGKAIDNFVKTCLKPKIPKLLETTKKDMCGNGTVFVGCATVLDRDHRRCHCLRVTLLRPV